MKTDPTVATSLPTAGLTALQAIGGSVQPKPGTRILIHGAEGAAGSFVTQIALAAGAQLIGIASGQDVEYLLALGRAKVVDYKPERFEAVGKVDGSRDLIGGETATRSYAVKRRRSGFDGRRGERGVGGIGGTGRAFGDR